MIWKTFLYHFLFPTYCFQELYLSAICMTAVPNSYWPRFGLMEGKIFVVTNASDKRNKCLLHKEWGSSITVSAVSNHLLVSCQQCIVWWSCQCHLRFVFYIICKTATFLRCFPYWVSKPVHDLGWGIKQQRPIPCKLAGRRKKTWTSEWKQLIVKVDSIDLKNGQYTANRAVVRSVSSY